MGHFGVSGKEKTDELARVHSSSPFIAPEPVWQYQDRPVELWLKAGSIRCIYISTVENQRDLWTESMKEEEGDL